MPKVNFSKECIIYSPVNFCHFATSLLFLHNDLAAILPVRAGTNQSPNVTPRFCWCLILGQYWTGDHHVSKHMWTSNSLPWSKAKIQFAKATQLFRNLRNVLLPVSVEQCTGCERGRGWGSASIQQLLCSAHLLQSKTTQWSAASSRSITHGPATGKRTLAPAQLIIITWSRPTTQCSSEGQDSLLKYNKGKDFLDRRGPRYMSWVWNMDRFPNTSLTDKMSSSYSWWQPRFFANNDDSCIIYMNHHCWQLHFFRSLLPGSKVPSICHYSYDIFVEMILLSYPYSTRHTTWRTSKYISVHLHICTITCFLCEYNSGNTDHVALWRAQVQ